MTSGTAYRAVARTIFGTAQRAVAHMPLSASVVVVALLGLASTGCRQDMHDQAKAKTLAYSDFFADHRAARPLVPGTVARGQLHLDEQLYTGKINGQYAETFPFAITAEDLRRGQERFNIFCSPCHGRLGDGNGMIVQRGFRRPSSYHEDRLRTAPPGYFFDVITNGFGTMYDYSDRIAPEDRWRIVAYIRALQLSQNADLKDVPDAERDKIPPPSTAPAGPVSLNERNTADERH